MTISPKKTKPVYAGLSITRHAAELAVFSPKDMVIESAASIPIPPGVFDQDGDIIYDAELLKDLLSQLFRSVKPKPAQVHLSLPGTLLRLVEMPKMEAAGLYVSLSSEAERYKTFDNAEAVVDFAPNPKANVPANQQQVVFGAVRSDTLGQYLKILKGLKVKTASVSLEPLTILKAMAGTGVLDGLVQQIGMDAHWGLILVEATRVRLAIWQCDHLVELRETAMETQEFATATFDSIAVEDLLEEIRRTTKATQPAVWLSHNLPPAMQQILTEKIGVPVHAAPLGQALGLSQPLQLSTVGASLTSMVPFPFDFDILAGLGKSGAESVSPSASISIDDSSGSGSSLIPLGVGSLILGGLVSAGLFVAALLSGQQIPALESKRDGIKMEVGTLEARRQELRKKAELDQALLAMIQKAKIRNHVYVALTDDLKNKTPEKIWVRSLEMNESLDLTGKALSHQSVINFARSFDEPAYAKDIVIKSIKEGRMGGALVFDFMIHGGINLDPAILDETAQAGLKTSKSGDA
jgi:Tfp pilus assembly PilM family ATPase/Tfp pilus assembly protein PilN